MTAVIRDIALRFVHHPAAIRLSMMALALAAFLLPMGPVGGGSGS